MDRLEKTILKNLIYNEEFSTKVIPFLKDEYFNDRIEKILFTEIFDFMTKYKKLPTHESLLIDITEKKSLSSQDVNDTIELLGEIRANKEDTTELEWLVDSTEKFCQDKAIYNAIMESVNILDDS